jgi:putative membrane protein
MSFFIRVIINAVAIWLTSLWVTGITITQAQTTGGQIVTVLAIAVVFGVINAWIKPIVQILSIPFYILTLGLFTLVVNALMLMLTSWLTEFTHWGLTVDGFWTAMWGAFLISVISFFLSVFVPDNRSQDAYYYQ